MLGGEPWRALVVDRGRVAPVAPWIGNVACRQRAFRDEGKGTGGALAPPATHPRVPERPMLESTFSSARSWSPTLALGLVAALAASPVAHAVGGDDADEAVVDRFHPDKGDGKAPLYGGRAIVHVPSLPENMCYPIENSAVTRRFLYETHETLLLQDWWSHDYVPDAAGG